VRVISWNLFHGRDAPPDPSLYTRRSRILGVEERGVTHVQVNRSLFEEFAELLAGEAWQLALLQEVPPRWLVPLCRRTGASGASALTARNLGAGARAWLADRRPDLLGSWEGGSNQLLVRPPWRIEGVRRLTLTRWPERRRLIFAELLGPGARRLAAANLHASISGRGPEADVLRAAERASAWSGHRPLVLGGDLNLRPRHSPFVFHALQGRFGLAPPVAPHSVDHVLARGLDLLGPPQLLEPRWRERSIGHRLLRLSDHQPVVAHFGMR
jgi:endonuclease/exonuclease/phosphatase family metal-dependent hydrolase